MLWASLLISIPLAGLHPIYVTIALASVLAMLGASALVYTFTRGEERAVRIVRAVGRRIPASVRTASNGSSARSATPWSTSGAIPRCSNGVCCGPG